MAKSLVEFKSPGGKMLKITAECTKTDCKILIAGDFFLYPEETVHALEASVSRAPTQNLESIQKQLDITLGLHQAELHGVSTREMAQCILEALSNARKDDLAAH